MVNPLKKATLVVSIKGGEAKDILEVYKTRKVMAKSTKDGLEFTYQAHGASPADIWKGLNTYSAKNEKVSFTEVSRSVQNMEPKAEKAKATK